jgi:hypothetical protein
MFYRQEQVEAYEAGRPERWIKDGIGPMRMTGNKDSYDLSGEHLLLLVLFKLILPLATLNQH